ncbi:hypothetical protein KIL84_019366 [Mauremys mutica]|uniref:Uncharacterized protein n=1 Tax=Mauremys mutica TaxID=74926 RepID=A0A9D3XVI0_9SAUR|nr:hypothetical protein KIL84_019366 [Mauremys mutica]
MASCTHIMFARLHLHCLHTWFQSSYSPEKDNINGRIIILANVTLCLVWWATHKKHSGGSSFSPTHRRGSYHHKCFPLRLGSPRGQSHCTRHLDPLRDQNVYKSTGIKGHSSSLQCILSTHLISIYPVNVRQHDDCLLHKHGEQDSFLCVWKLC